MSNAAREMIRTYFGIIESGSDARLQKIRELRRRDDDRLRAERKQSSWFPFGKLRSER